MYFSNSSHGAAFDAKNCDRCKRSKPNDPDNDCPLKTAAFVYNGVDGAAGVLNMLQTMEHPGDSIGICLMLEEAPSSAPSMTAMEGHKLKRQAAQIKLQAEEAERAVVELEALGRLPHQDVYRFDKLIRVALASADKLVSLARKFADPEV